MAAAASAIATPTSSAVISRRRETTSPRGTSNKMPIAYPACVSVGMMPMPRAVTPNGRAICASNGWL